MIRDRPFYPGYRTREAKRANTAALVAADAGDYALKEMWLRYALACAPHFWELWLNLGNALRNQGKHQSALEAYYRAHHMNPLSHVPLIEVAHTLLMLGEYREGWQMYEERWRNEGFKAITASGIVANAREEQSKKWDGIARPGKRLLVFNEQGGGDVIMMLRYRELLEATGMELVWQVPAGFLRLLQYHRPLFGEICTNREQTPAHDYHVPMMSLPYLLGTWTMADIPKAPYLRSGVDAKVMELSGLRVGICWRGQPGHKADLQRSIGLERCLPLFQLPNISWVNLTFGDKDEKEIVEHNPPIYLPSCYDYYDTAGVVKALDLVVTVDSSVLHLAGALGVPTLGMIPNPSEWRWGIRCKAEHWYPTVDLIRQTRYHDWSSVIQEVTDFLLDELQRQAA